MMMTKTTILKMRQMKKLRKLRKKTLRMNMTPRLRRRTRRMTYTMMKLMRKLIVMSMMKTKIMKELSL